MKHKSNIELVLEYMNEHPLNQAFVIEALARYSKQITESKAEIIESMQHSFVSGEAWVHCAESWLQQKR